MRFPRSPQLALLSLITASTLAGCAPPTPDLEEPHQSANTAKILDEIPGRAESSWKFYKDPVIARVAYATPSLQGCTGTMIGPNTLISAAHCGNTDKTIDFLTFRKDDSAVFDKETFHCALLLNGFPHTDLTIFFCGPNAAGESPGDKYGYVDIDARPVGNGDLLFSLSRHNLTARSIWDGQLYIPGAVTRTDFCIWGQQQCQGDIPMHSRIGIQMDMVGEGGMSGSGHFNDSLVGRPGWLRVGPMSTNGGGRSALSMATLLAEARPFGWVDQGVPQTGIASSNLTILGIDPNRYAGVKFDRDNNQLFDIQEEIEQIRRENRRDWIFLGFRSARRNRAAWAPDSLRGTFSVDSGNYTLALDRAPSARTVVLATNPLPIDQNGTYRVTFKVRTFSVDAPAGAGWLNVGFGPFFSSPVSPSVDPSGDQTFTVSLIAPTARPRLEFAVDRAVRMSISDVTIVREGATMDFDSADERIVWEDASLGSPALVLPRGRTEGTPNWAGLVGLNGSSQPLSSDQLGLRAGKAYRICFDYRVVDGSRADRGAVAVTSGDRLMVQTSFATNSTWQTACTDTPSLPSRENRLSFGSVGFDAQPYLVDNVTITAK